MADKTSTYTVKVKGDAGSAKEAADELSRLRDQINGAKANVQTYSQALRNLRGSSDEVKGAKEALKAKIEAEKNAISAATVAALKQGVNLDELASKERKVTTEANKLAQATKKVAAETKEGAEAQAGLAKGLELAGGPMGDLVKKVQGLSGDVSKANTGMSMLGLAAGAAVTAIVAVGAAVGSLVIELGKFIFLSANAARTAFLQRQAWTGTEASARALGNQIDALSAKVATPKEKLSELSGQLVKTFSGTMMSGQGIVDTFNAVAQASEAMGDDAGRNLQGILERGKQFGRVQINPFELQGSGVSRDDIATALASRMKIGVDQARQALAQGRVKVDDAAKAIRDAVEKRFGEINGSKLLDVDVQIEKFKTTLAGLAKNVNLQPLLKDLDKIFSLFDPTKSVTGVAIKQLIELLGRGLVGALDSSTPAVVTFFETMVLLSLRAGIAFFKVRNFIRDMIPEDARKKLAEMSGQLEIARPAAYALAAGVGVLAANLALAAVAMGALLAPFFILPKITKLTEDKVKGTDWAAIGKSIPEGITTGLLSGVEMLKTGAMKLADAVKNAFTGALQIHSPSKVFEDYGRQTTEGYSRGVDSGSQGAQTSVDAMAPSAPKARGGARGGPVSVTVNLNIAPGAGQGGQQIAQELSSPEFLRALTKAIEDALAGVGVPTQVTT